MRWIFAAKANEWTVMKMRLIDADVFEELFDKQIEYGATDIFDAVEDALQDTPTIDAVPVIRCKDCKHRGGYHCPMYHTETSLDDLDGFDDYNVDRTDNNGFCHRGEKKG